MVAKTIQFFSAFYFSLENKRHYYTLFNTSSLCFALMANTHFSVSFLLSFRCIQAALVSAQCDIVSLLCPWRHRQRQISEKKEENQAIIVTNNVLHIENGTSASIVIIGAVNLMLLHNTIHCFSSSDTKRDALHLPQNILTCTFPIVDIFIKFERRN